MHRIAIVVALLATSVALADTKHPQADDRIQLPDLVQELALHTGKVINIPGPLETKPSDVHACGHDKKQWVALEIVDRGTSLVAYCPIGKVAGCKMLAKPASVMHALVKVTTCKQGVELLGF